MIRPWRHSSRPRERVMWQSYVSKIQQPLHDVIVRLWCIEKFSPVSYCIVQSFTHSQVVQAMSASISSPIDQSPGPPLTQVSRIMQAGPTSTWVQHLKTALLTHRCHRSALSIDMPIDAQAKVFQGTIGLMNYTCGSYLMEPIE
jgi:hypothetical protein